ncbi:MAG TPA: hypothetical protein VF615_18545 [Longimicrobiaceae bacterium]
MRKFDDLEPDEMPEVLRAAVRDREQEQERELERASIQEAATEMGVSAEHLDRAAAETHARRVEEVRRRRRIRNWVVAAGVAALAGAGVYRVANPAPPEPTVYTFQDASQAWSGEVNGRTVARVSEQGGRGVIEVERFGPEADGRYWANLNTVAVPASLRGAGEVTLRVRGTGLQHARLFLENGPTERWRSPDVMVGPEWRTVTFKLDQFEHQTRQDTGSPWRGRGGGSPERLTRVSIKVGEPFNPPDARGRAEVDDLRIE